MSIESVVRKRETRKIKGNPPTIYVYDKCIRGKHRGQLIKKPLRPNILTDVLELRKQNKTRDEIHSFGCEKYFFIDDNPWEDRYLKYIEENKL